MNKYVPLAVLVTAAVSYTAGYADGDHYKPPRSPAASSPTPQQQIKTVTKTVHDTVTVVKPLPASCQQLVSLLGEAGGYAGLVTKLAGEHLTNESDAAEAMIAKDLPQLIKVTNKENALKPALDESAVNLYNTQQTIELQLKQCNADSRS